MTPLRRGDIWIASAGSTTGKPRPWIIFRADIFSEYNSITMIPLTSQAAEGPTRVFIPADDVSGIDFPSYAMTDKVHTHKYSVLGTHCGRVTAEQLTDIERAVLTYLGITR